MTTEDDFQRQLDLHPDDHHTRLVFADWLEERGDARAEGYRVMGRSRLQPMKDDGDEEPIRSWFSTSAPMWKGSIPSDWLNLIAEGLPQEPSRPVTEEDSPSCRKDQFGIHWVNFPNRRQAEDAAAIGFSKLPLERRTELLSVPI